MKAIYLNLDPYLQAVADWLNAGKSGTAPSFDPLPVAVTIPLGESAAIFSPQRFSDGEYAAALFQVDGIELYANDQYIEEEGFLERNIALGFSAFSTNDTKYSVYPVDGNTNITVGIGRDSDTDPFYTRFTIPVLVRRETASGPVDLVDFTPPASAIAAGTDLKGTKFDGNEIVAAANTGALSAPAAGG